MAGSTSPKVAVNLGTGFTQDRSLEVFRNADEFLRRHLKENEDRVFVARLAMRTCLVVASNSLASEYGRDPRLPEDFYNGLKDFVFGLFGQSILFAGSEAETRFLRKQLVPLFVPDEIHSFDEIIVDLTSHWVATLSSGPEDPILYHSFKHLSLSINLKVFLGIDLRQQPEYFSTISELCTTHWHGIISVPINVKLFMSSSFRKAKEAKERLLQIIEQRLATNQVPFLKCMKEKCELDKEALKNHLLIFVCALIPKAAASILTSMVDSAHLWHKKFVDENGDISDQALENIILETIRLWPPFIGSLRVAKTETMLGPFHIHKGQGVFLATFMAHRDPETFPFPEEFMPERWETFNKEDKDRLFGFGCGVHKCVGEKYMWTFFVHVAKTFIKAFKWDVGKYQTIPRKLKYLPVTRPLQLDPTQLTPR